MFKNQQSYEERSLTRRRWTETGRY